MTMTPRMFSDILGRRTLRCPESQIVAAVGREHSTGWTSRVRVGGAESQVPRACDANHRSDVLRHSEALPCSEGEGPIGE